MIRAWVMQHGLMFFLTLKRLISTPVASLLSVIVMGIALSLPAGIYVFMKNLQSISGQAVSSPQMSLFLKLDAVKEDIERIRQYLEENAQIVSFEFVSKDVALHQLQQHSGLTDVTASLAHNPLPDAFIVHTLASDTETLEQLRMTMQKWPEIEHVQFDSAWVERLNALLKLGHYVILMLTTLLSVAIIAIMFNTIRLQILTKRDEIELSRLIGATNGFIRRPFLYFGAVQGLASGITAWSIIAFAIETVNEELVTLTRLYDLELHLQHLSSENSISLLIFSSWLGWLGARLSVASHLWQIEPR
ncbi:permease-like cell division protein FtsX [Nitrosomonas sp. Nm166]|uniref:permease-like cell division protein FtsX n=1 Tax=Nitrosomonas sp. Nm166 TaxID=1881054 RepID=UPI0008EE7139|nr:permease-like cell division protein FtsX [Nitrosomonas sp. Nm166]SFE70814.1 cell division transport system permease protein [Nitrosomonas sp. Nm166]